MKALNFKNKKFTSVPELINDVKNQGYSLKMIGRMVGTTEGYIIQLKGGFSKPGKNILVRFYELSKGTLDIIGILKEKGNGKRKLR